MVSQDWRQLYSLHGEEPRRAGNSRSCATARACVARDRRRTVHAHQSRCRAHGVRRQGIALRAAAEQSPARARARPRLPPSAPRIEAPRVHRGRAAFWQHAVVRDARGEPRSSARLAARRMAHRGRSASLASRRSGSRFQSARAPSTRRRMRFAACTRHSRRRAVLRPAPAEPTRRRCGFSRRHRRTPCAFRSSIAAFPDALFIFLWRDPRENLSSIIEAWRAGDG